MHLLDVGQLEPNREKEWPRAPLGDLAIKIQDGTHFSPASSDGPYRYITSRNVRFGYLDLRQAGWISERDHRAIYARCDVRKGDVLLTKDGANTGNAALNTLTEEVSLLSSVAFIRPDEDRLLGPYLLQYLLSQEGQRRLQELMAGNAITRLTLEKIRAFDLPVPPVHHQRTVADALNALDQAIDTTERVIAKLQRVKLGMLRTLLGRGLGRDGAPRDPTGTAQFRRSHVGSIPADWSICTISDVAEILDHLRVPVNADERSKRPGIVPYFGANGLQGWIDRPLFDEPLILLAEDGGNFDAYAHRPIAYRIDGPAWVNNHAHVLRAASGVNQSFLFFALQHRDIRRYISGGTRTKLTQAELRAVEIPMPERPEQDRIAAVFEALEARRVCDEVTCDKLRALKQGLVHDLMTRKRPSAARNEGYPT